MATGSYEGGGIGGKIRRRPLRAAAAATPYDRPPAAAAAAARGVRGAPEAGRTSGWLSKLVDPASRLIAGSASKLFSSVFRKQLPALPPPETGGNVQYREEIPEVTPVNPSLQTLDNQIGDGNNLTNNSGDESLSELEKLLKQKTFTRSEFDHLTELLRSRTIEPDASKLAVNNDKKEESNVSKIELGLGSFRSHGVVLNPAASGTIPKEEAASPTELAKAYMVSRSSKGSPSNFSLRSHVLLQDKETSSNAVYGTKTPLASVGPRSTLRSPALPGLNENGYITPRLNRRSAIYRMSRSPYFKGASSSNDVYALPSSSHQTPTKSMHSAGTQVLKRRSSVLDDEIGYVGPIRRIRQKSNMMSPSKDSRTIHHGNLLPSSSGTLENEVIDGSGTIQKPSGVSKLDYTTDFENKEDKDNRILDDGIPPIPPQSATMALKILKELDKLAPSPKEKSSEIKVAAKVESTSKLNLRSSWDMDAAGGSPLSGKQDRLKDDDLLNGPLLGIKSTSQVGSAHAFTFVRNATSNVGEISHSAAVPTRGKPGFQMVIPEDSSEIDDDSGNAVEAPVNNVADKAESKTLEQKVESKTSDKKSLNFEAAGADRPLISAAKSTPSFDLVSSSVAEKEVPSRGLVNNSTNFTFSVSPAPTNHLEQPPTPTMATPSPGIPAREKEQTAAPIFSFGLKKSPTPALPSTSTSAGVEVGTRSGRQLVTETSIFDSLKTEKGDAKRKAIESSNVPETAVSSAAPPSATSTPIFAFGASSSSSLSNGLLHSSAPKFSFPAAPAVTSSEGPVGSVFSTSLATSSNLFSSSAAPVFPTVPSFGSGSTISIGSHISARPSEKFGDTANATTVGATSVVSNSSLPDPVTSSALSSSSISSSPLATSSTFSSTGSLSDSKPSTLFSSLGGAQSSSAPSLPFTATGNSPFGFSTSAQSAVTTSSSQTGFTFGGIAGAAFGTQSTQSRSSTQQLPQSSPSQSSSQAGLNFGIKAGADLGTQSAQSGSNTQQPSQSSSSHFSSFTATAPTFTFGSSQTSLRDSQFGSTAAASKPSSSSSGFPFSATTATPSSSSFMVSKPFSSSSGLSFAASSAPSSSSSAASSIPVSPTLFSSSSAPSTPSTFNTTFGSASSTSVGFAFGQPASSPSTSSFPFGQPASSSNTSPFAFGQPAPSPSTSPFAFNMQTGSAFSFTSASATANSSPARPLFGTPSPVTGFSSGSPGNNDQMNVEDTMTDDTAAPSAAVSMVPTFGQPGGAPATPVFGASPIPSGGAPLFQFGGNQQNSLPQNPSPFQPGGNLEFQGGSSFSLGSGGGDKSGRRIVKINRSKLRKK